MSQLKTKLGTLALAGSLLMGASTNASAEDMYEVTVTNLTYSQVFSPILVVSHFRDISLFELGQPASEGLAALAEGGATQPIIDSVAGNFRVRGAAVSDGPVVPGATATIMVPVNRAGKISLASMMVNTNDAFLALDTVTAYSPERTYYALAYDAGSEGNDEACANIPGPACGGSGAPGTGPEGEGFVHIHRGVHGIGDLDESVYDWRNPVAKVTVRLVR